MIEYRIRWEHETQSSHLCNGELTDIANVLRTLSSWGVADHEPRASYDETFCQFVVPEGNEAGSPAYFEIVLVEA